MVIRKKRKTTKNDWRDLKTVLEKDRENILIQEKPAKNLDIERIKSISELEFQICRLLKKEKLVEAREKGATLLRIDENNKVALISKMVYLTIIKRKPKEAVKDFWKLASLKTQNLHSMVMLDPALILLRNHLLQKHKRKFESGYIEEKFRENKQF